MNELGKGYTERNLRNMRKFYIQFSNFSRVRIELSWSHYRLLLPLKSQKEIEYYISISIVQNLSCRELSKRIRNNEYERIENKEELKTPKIDTLIKEPIIVKTINDISKINEKFIHRLILEDMDNFLKEFGLGFTYVGSEVPIKIGNINHYIDFLLFNYIYNCFVVVELKTVAFKAEHIGQVLKYINYVDRHIKTPFNEKTVGVIICQKENELVFKYCTDDRIFVRTYKLENKLYKSAC